MLDNLDECGPVVLRIPLGKALPSGEGIRADQGGTICASLAEAIDLFRKWSPNAFAATITLPSGRVLDPKTIAQIERETRSIRSPDIG